MSTSSALFAVSLHFTCLVCSVYKWKNFRQDATAGTKINSRFLLPMLFKAKGGKAEEKVNSLSKYQVKTASFCTRINFSVNYYSIL